ncbi:MAG: tetratricopeptide repeat protein [Lentisphaeraceae bacterium]|nr:tetratricopeptide repeat protein [Lentisphaeraceae bacterium]
MFRFLLLLFLFTSSIFANEKADKLWKDANKFYEQGEEQIRKSSYGESVVLFKASLDMLTKLQYNFPTWNVSVVKNRQKACRDRIADADKLILQGIQNLSKEELIEELKTTQIAKAKFSKAMMILYDDLKKTKQELLTKVKALNSVREAAGSRVADKAHLDKLTFENLKLRKKLRDKEAELIAARAGESMEVSDKRVDVEILKYKELQNEIVQKEEKISAEKSKLATQLKGLSIKYNDLLAKEKKFETILDELKKKAINWRDDAEKEKDLRQEYAESIRKLKAQLKLESEKIKDAKAREAEMVNAVAALKKNGGSTKMVANLTERNDDLMKDIDRLKKIEIDLSAKVRTLENAHAKTKNTLKQHIETTSDAMKDNTRFKQLIADYEKNNTKINGLYNNEKSTRESLESEVKSLKSQMKILQSVADGFKAKIKKLAVAKAPASAVKKDAIDDKLMAAYEKQLKDNKGKIDFMEKRLRELEQQNRVLKEENVSGDEELIKKYVQVRDELKVSKVRARKLYDKLKRYDSDVEDVIQSAMSSDERADKEKSKKINNLLFEASRQENNQTAIGLYTQVLKIDKNNFDALLRIGLLMYEERHFHDAVINLQKAFYIQPDNAQLLLGLGVSLLELEKLDLAVSSLSRLAGKYPKNAEAQFQLGVVMQGLGWNEAAIVRLTKALELNPQNGDAAFNLAACYLSLPEPNVDEAKKYYNRSVELGVVRDPVLEKYFSDK